MSVSELLPLHHQNIINEPLLSIELTETDLQNYKNNILDFGYSKNSVPRQSPSVNPGIPDRLLEGYQIDPIIDYQKVQGLGNISLSKVRETVSSSTTEYKRQHRLYTIELDGFHHVAEITDPVESFPESIIISFPGFTESIENNFRKDLHQHLSYKFPLSRIVSIATDGIGASGDHYGWRDCKKHDIPSMAEHRINIAGALSSDTPVYAMGTSMGSVIWNRVCQLNANLDKPILDIKGQFLLSPALVDPSNIVKDMFILTLPTFWKDVVTEICWKTEPHEALNIIKGLGHYGMRRTEIVSLINQAVSLFEGTKEEQILEVSKNIPTIVVAGDKDPLAQLPMWKRIQKNVGNEQMLIEVIAGRGHGLAMRASKACDKIARLANFFHKENNASLT